MAMLLLLCFLGSFGGYSVLGYSSGVTGLTTSGCSCHGTSSSATTLTAQSSSGSFRTRPGQTLNLTVIVAHNTQSAAGIDIAVHNQSGQNAGSLSPGSGSGLQLSNNELTHTQPKTMSGGQASFSFSWTAPTTPGTYTLRAVGNAVNGNGNANGDAWNFMSPVTLTVAGITVVEPNGGETWCAGSTKSIRWNSTGVDYVTIELSSNGGQTWTTLATNVPASAGSWSWAIPSGQQPGSQYRIRISDASDAQLFDISDGNFSISGPPQITQQPQQPQPVCEGTPVTLSVVAQGSGLSYQWRLNGQNLPGTNIATYQFIATTSAAGVYDVVVSNACGSVTSDTVRLTVRERPRITQHPQSLTVCAGQQAVFRVTATGANIRYQWRKNGTPIPGATTATYTITTVQPADSGLYDVVVSGDCEPPAYSMQARLTVVEPPVITHHPQSQTVRAGQSVTFRVEARGAELQYQWRKNGVAIAGAIRSEYTIAAAQLSDAGTYDCLIWNGCGQVTSRAAQLTVTQPGQPVLALRQSSVDFATRELGDSITVELRGVVYNAGDDTLRVTAVTIAGPHAADFRLLSGGGSFILAPQQDRTLTIAFVPTATGERTAEIRFTANVSSPPSLALRGTSAIPQLLASAILLDFDTVELGTGKELPLRLTNPGPLRVTVTELSLGVSTHMAFSLVNPPQTPIILDSGQSLELTLRFTPLNEGDHGQHLEAAYAGTFRRDTLRITLRGVGKRPVSVGEGLPSGVMLRVLPNPSAEAFILEYALPEAARLLAAEIMTSEGKTVRRLPVEYPIQGTLTWDGRTESGSPCVSGLYWIRLSLGQCSYAIPLLLQR
ncbi:MAG: immunoglobulin domain-containing protein [Candidatus Kapabacteria bacterium]|nr:immunoglobulin domain-containing protein [Candidatus Kapabacteria bacterium]